MKNERLYHMRYNRFFRLAKLKAPPIVMAKESLLIAQAYYGGIFGIIRHLLRQWFVYQWVYLRDALLGDPEWMTDECTDTKRKVS